MKINLNDCVLIGESNKIFDIMLAYNMYLDDQIECSCYNDAGKQAKGLYEVFASYITNYPQALLSLNFMKNIIKSCDGLEKIVLYHNEYYYLYDNAVDCTDIFVRDLKIVGNVLILICD